MKVLSLCDGMSCGQIALTQLNIPIEEYYAAEIKDIAIKVTNKNFPNTIQIGDLNKVSFKDGVLYSEKGEFSVGCFDLVMFGSPCQSFSIAMRTEGRIGLEDKKRSGLFLECYRILKEVNPTYFFVENVATMKNEDRDILSNMLGVKPIKIDSAIVAPCYRKRYYWTNIPIQDKFPYKEINLQDILDYGYTNKKKGTALLASDSRPLTTPVKMFYRANKHGFTNLIYKSKEHFEQCKNYFDTHYKELSAKEVPVDETDIFDGVRYLNQKELERCQTVPEGYTDCLTRNQAADVLGDGWTIDIIKWFFSFFIDKY